MYLFLLLVVYLSLIIFLNSGIKKNRKLSTSLNNSNVTDSPFISLLIPFHNEETNLPILFNSIIEQNMKKSKFEVIWLNDRSTDKSPHFIREKISDYPNHKLITIDKLPFGKSGKRNALQEGIKRSNGDIIVFTDADCKFDPNWLQNILNSFSVGGSDIYGGPVTKISPGLLGRILRWEQYLNHKICEGFFGFGKPVLIFGANWAIKKKLFFEGGGYSGTDSTLSGDDDLLVQKLGQESITAIWDNENIVFTEGPEGWSHWWRQKRRHISAGMKYNFLGKFFYGLLHLSNLIILLSPLFFSHGLILLLIKVLIDWIWLFSPGNIREIFTGIVESMLFQIYIVISNWIVGLISFVNPSKNW